MNVTAEKLIAVVGPLCLVAGLSILTQCTVELEAANEVRRMKELEIREREAVPPEVWDALVDRLKRGTE